MRGLACFLALILAGPALADERPADAFPLRSHNPVLQVYGLPAFQTAQLVAPGRFDINLSYDVANDADDADRPTELLVIDAETQVLNLSVRRRIGERFEIGMDVPYVRHTGGNLDRLIYRFHDLVGLSNSAREGADDRFRLLFERQGETLLDLASPVAGLGDIRVSAAMAVGQVTLRAAVKAPTGDAARLTGSGAADFSLGVYGGGRASLFDRELEVSGFVGVLRLGNGDVLPTLQRKTVPYGGAALRWHATPRLSLATQLYVQGQYLDADLGELGGNTLQLAFGGDYRFAGRPWLLRIAIAEDVAAAAAPDFALHLSIRRFTR